MAKKNLVLATAREPLGGEGVPCIHHLNRVCAHGSEGEDCLFYHVGDFAQIMQCEQDRHGKKCVKGHSCAYWHVAVSNQGLMGKQEGQILPYPPSSAAHTRQPRGFGRASPRGAAAEGRGDQWIRRQQDCFFPVWMETVHEVPCYWCRLGLA